MSNYKYFTTTVKNADIYMGKGAGKKLLKQINKAQNQIVIVSPYINVNLIDLLVSKAEQGINVSLISYYDENSFNYYHKLMEKLILQEQYINTSQQEKKEKIIKKKNIFMFIFITCICLFLSLLYFFIMKSTSVFEVINSILVVFILLVGLIIYLQYLDSVIHFYPIYYYEYSRKIDFYMLCADNMEFLHSKIYLIDDMLFMGSANFTRNGLYNNLEVMMNVKDVKTVNDVQEYIECLKQHNNIIHDDFFTQKFFVEQNY